MVILSKGKYSTIIEVWLLVDPYKIVYNWTLGIPFSPNIDIVSSIVHLKMKYHNIHNKSMIIYADLDGSLHLRRALQYNLEATPNPTQG